MQKQLHFFIIDDDESALNEYTSLLEQAGHRITIEQPSQQTIAHIITDQPDVIICNPLLPGYDGLELFQVIRKTENIRQPKFIIITAKQFDYDRRRAIELGVDGYLIKPVNMDTFIDNVMEIVIEKMSVRFWGIRGTLPVPGLKSLRYGGNTNCVTLCFAKKYFFIFDAGSGIKELSNYLVNENAFPMEAKIFISHPHYDHINGLPFFVPMYMQGNEFEIIGPNDGDKSIESIISGQMDSVYFPVTTKEFAAKISFRDVGEEEFDIDELHVKTILLNHPGKCLGYRVQYKNKSFCYITDNELNQEDSQHFNQNDVDRLIEFISNANILIIDSTYTDEEYAKKTGWGHSPISRVIDVADKARVKLLCLHHHDPDQSDDDIDRKLQQARELLEQRHSATKCIAPREGEEILI